MKTNKVICVDVIITNFTNCVYYEKRPWRHIINAASKSAPETRNDVNDVMIIDTESKPTHECHP